MEIDGTTLIVLGVIFLATLIRSAFGFGEALVSVPLLALLIPVKVAVPLAVLMSVIVAAVILIHDWRKVHFQSAWRLVLATLIGIPFGLWLLRSVEENIVKAILATVIISFSTYCLWRRTRLELHNDKPAWIFGFFAGILGGAYGMNGPPLVIYGALRRWTPEHFRATLQGYFLPASFLGLAGYWWEGLVVSDVTRLFILSLPGALAAIFLGRVVNRRLGAGAFVYVVHIGLIMVGFTLLVQSIGFFSIHESLSTQ